MKTLYEGILGDIEDNLKAADDYTALLAKAEADWKKLLKTKRTFQAIGNMFGIKIKSTELAKYLCKDIVSDEYYDKHQNDLLYVYILINYVDCLYPETHCKISIQANDNTDSAIIAGRMNYLSVKDCKELDKETGNSLDIPLKTCYKLLLDKLQNSSMLKDLKMVKQKLADDITYNKCKL